MKPCNNSCYNRFWSKVLITDNESCWPWMWNADPKGYGIFKCGGNNKRAPRVAFFLTHGYWPNVCRHTCDNPTCCNPSHLLDGTNQDNVRDKVERGRMNPQKGQDRPLAKLCNKDVPEIRALLRDGMSQRKIASMFGVSQAVIMRINRNTHWKHV